MGVQYLTLGLSHCSTGKISAQSEITNRMAVLEAEALGDHFIGYLFEQEPQPAVVKLKVVTL